MRILPESQPTNSANVSPAARPVFYPLSTIKCRGPAVFRSQTARDVACLLDVDDDVASWTCMPSAIDDQGHPFRPDFEVSTTGSTVYYLDAPDRTEITPDTLLNVEPVRAAPYRVAEPRMSATGFRLANAKDLLRYGSHKTPLGDRVRLLAVLEEQGSLTLVECLSAFQETRPVPGLASMILHGYLEVDLDTAPLGPETIIRRKR